MVVLAGTRTGSTTTPTASAVRAAAEAIALRLDVTRPETIHAAVDYALDRFGAIDVLVNNAGVSDGPQNPLTIDFAVAEQVWDVNVTGAWRTANAVIPIMRDKGYGRIVNVSSTLGSLHHMTKASEPAYRVSKAALNALTRVLAADVAGTGILVNAASPGWVRTDLGGPNAPRTVEQGADTPVWLATLPNDGPTGEFFYERKPLEW
jgi:NAD(P)-dependent dehydrogenase (short-subunit alcohol dehydrogenase family)